MARKLGLKPKKFGGLDKHFRKSRPENIWSIEQMVSDAKKKTERRARK